MVFEPWCSCCPLGVQGEGPTPRRLGVHRPLGVGLGVGLKVTNTMGGSQGFPGFL